MKKEISTSIQIKANPEIVWNILTDFEKYPKWNPFITSVKGNPQVGEKIEVHLQNMTFKPEVLVYDKNQEFKWKGKLLFKGLFDGEHRFLLEKNEDGTTTFTQSEKFSGILVKLFSKNLDTKTLDRFKEMNEKLKARAEEK